MSFVDHFHMQHLRCRFLVIPLRGFVCAHIPYDRDKQAANADQLRFRQATAHSRMVGAQNLKQQSDQRIPT